MIGAAGCDEAVGHLSAFLEGGLDGPDRAVVEAHLAVCARCCGELAVARELRGLLRATAATAELPTDVRTRLEGVIDRLDGTATGTAS